MSCTEHYTGKLSPTGLTVREYLDSEYFVRLSNEAPSSADLKDEEDVMELFYENFYRKATVLDGKVFEVKELVRFDECDSIFEMSPQDKGYSFRVMFYNGGMDFDEALQEAAKELKKKV